MLLCMSDIKTDMQYVSKSIVFLSILYAFVYVTYTDNYEICIKIHGFPWYFVCFCVCQIYRKSSNMYQNPWFSLVFGMLLCMSDIQTDMKYESKSNVFLTTWYAFVYVRYTDRYEI